MTDRVEQQSHDAIWRLANDHGRVERAVGDARGLCYAILDAPEEDPEMLRWLAERWLKEFGRDPLRERNRAVPYPGGER